jgi:hypothetical protein
MSKYTVSNGFITLQYYSEKEADEAVSFLNGEIP